MVHHGYILSLEKKKKMHTKMHMNLVSGKMKMWFHFASRERKSCFGKSNEFTTVLVNDIYYPNLVPNQIY